MVNAKKIFKLAENKDKISRERATKPDLVFPANFSSSWGEKEEEKKLKKNQDFE